MDDPARAGLMQGRCARAGRWIQVLALLLAVLGAAPLAGQSLPRRFDCGDLNGYAAGEPGYELITPTSGPPDVTFSPAPLDVVHVGGNFPGFWGDLPHDVDVLAADPDELHQIHRRTSLQLANDTVLSVTGLVPGRPYRLRLELGALAPWGEVTTFFEPPYFTYYPSLMQKGRVELPDGAGGWRTWASNIRCATSGAGSTFASFISSIVPLWVRAEADATGRVQVRLSNDDTAFPGVYLAGFELHEHEALPIVYRRTASGPLQGSSAGVAAFVTAFNSGDLATAQALALDLADDFERGVALAHLVGWLDGSRDELFHLRDEALAALEAAVPDHPAAAWLADELTSLDRALAHLAASGFEEARKCPDDGGTGFLNPECADQSQSSSDLTHTNANAQIAVRLLRGMTAAVSGATVLHDLVNWNAGALPAGQWEPSPLVFAAAKLTAATLVAMHPNIKVSDTDVDAAAMAAQRDGLLHGFLDLGFQAADFPRDQELILLEHYVTQQKLPPQWVLATFENLLTPEQIAASWWGPEVAIPALVPGVPFWANIQRQQRSLQRALARYWLQERRVHGALGGGLGDDVELLGQLSTVFGGLQDQDDRRALDGLDAMLTWILEDSGEVQEGYFAGGMTDVEHSAEYTSHSWLGTAVAFGQTARAAGIGLGVGRHLRWSHDPAAAFAAPTSLGRLHFRSWWMTTTGPSDDLALAHDILLNGRAMSPAVGHLARGLLPSSHPLVGDLSAWADAWRLDALDTSGGKPLGWLGPVQFPSNAFGKSGLWWNHTGQVADTAELTAGVAAFQYELLREAYDASSSASRFLYLVPALRMFQSVIAWEDAGEPDTPATGSSAWAAQRFAASPRFGPLVISHLGTLAADPTLTSLADPLDPAGPYVDAAFLDRLRQWVEVDLTGQHPALRYALQPILPCGMPPTAKSQFTFVGNYQATLPYYRVLFPLLTKHVIHTDRVNLTFGGGGPANLLASINATTVVEGVTFAPVARWRAPPGGRLDLSVQCNGRDYGSTLYSAFVHNFAAQDAEVTLQVDDGLLPGEYLLEQGPAVQSCDTYPDGVDPSLDRIVKRGAGMSVDLSLPPGLSLVRLTRLGDAAPPAGHDLAVDLPRVERLPTPEGLRLAVRARVTNPGRTTSPPTTLRLWAAPLDADGRFVDGAVEQLLAQRPVPALDPCVDWSVDGVEVAVELWVPGGASVGAGGALAGTGVLGAESTGVSAAGAAPALVTPSSSVGLAGQQAFAVLLQGGAVQLRAEVATDGWEGDTLNNSMARGWSLDEIPLAAR